MADPFRLRPAGTADAAALSLVASAAFLDAYARVLDGADLVAHCLNHNTAERFAAWVGDAASVVMLAEAEPGGAPLGYSVLTASDFPIPPERGDIELRRIYTLRQAHGSGMGAALMARAVADAVQRGCRRMLLGVWDQNHRARAFYERSGFRVIGSREFQIGREIHVDPIYARDLTRRS